MNDIVAYLLNILLIFVEAVTLHQLGCAFFEHKRRGWATFGMIVALTAAHIAALLIAGGRLPVKLALIFLTDLLWLRLMFRQHPLKCMAVSAIFSTVMVMGDMIALFGLSVLTGQDIQTMMQDPYAYYALCYAVKILEMLLIVLLRIILRSRSPLYSATWQDWGRSIAFPLISSITAIMLEPIITRSGALAPYAVFCMIILAFADILSIYFLDYIDRQQQKLRDYTILNRSMKLEQNNVAAWMDAYAAQRRQTHEYHNQLEVIRGMAQLDGAGAELVDYVSKLLQSQTQEEMPVSTGRTVVDVILNQKNAIARNKEIEFYVNLDDLIDFALPDDALTVVLSNLIDNAIEASEKIAEPSQRLIRLNMRVEPEASFLYIENRTAEPVKIVDNRVSTTKKDAAAHGYGLKNVAAIMEQYGAEYVLDYQEDAGMFCFSAQIVPADH